MGYKLTQDPLIITRTEDDARIPLDGGNASYAEYLLWLAASNTPLAADPLTQDQQNVVAAKGYGKLNALQNMTPAQARNWVDTNVTNLAQVIDAIKTLTVAVSVLSKRL